MTLLPSFFSNADYYKNYDFQRLMRNWNTYMKSDEPSEQILYEWEEVLLRDFNKAAHEWLLCCREYFYDDKHLE